MIFYFSATGNSKYVASRISKITGDEIIAMDHCLKNNNLTFEAIEDENIGIVVPSYSSELPTIVDEFFEKLNLTRKGNGYNFAVVTFGMNLGATDFCLKKAMNKKSLSLEGLFSVRFPDTYSPIFDVSDKKMVQKRLDEAEPVIDDIITKITGKTKGNFITKNAPHGLSSLIHKFMYENKRKTKKFSVDDSCIGCKLCAQKCPVDAIEMQNNRPVWVKEQCVLCFGCLHRCPQHAIQYGDTKKHGQYVNPNITI
jgi:NAD-dependent dihydropyrimidine dehydrogenase PreA subunit/flavodoxin